jgi:tRNA pseudouridine13 synthase
MMPIERRPLHGYLTSGLPGVSGDIKDTPEDFLVTEIPAYEPCGSGEHLYLTIEKRGITTLEAIRRISAVLRIPEKDVGYAGMKDAVGVTRQTFSVPGISPETVYGRDFGQVKVLSAEKHTNKLKLGHLKGNQFSVRLQGVSGSVSVANEIMEVLVNRGVPNWFGYQRYGIHGNSHLIGLAMLRREWRSAIDHLIGNEANVDDDNWKSAIRAYHAGDLPASARLFPRHCSTERDLLHRLISRPDQYEKAFNAVHPRMKKLYLSAFQSSLFDRVVGIRLQEIDRVCNGDLAWKHLNGACFLVKDEAVENVRAAEFEISATGPMIGSKMKQPKGRALLIEQQLQDEYGLSSGDYDLGGGLRLEGERRALRVPIGAPDCRLSGHCLHLEFTLPKGSYATSVVREFTKNF